MRGRGQVSGWLFLLALLACSDSAEPRFDREMAAALRPAAGQSEQAAQLRAAVRALPADSLLRSRRGLVPTRSQDGVIKLDLQGRFQHASVAVIGGDGQRQASCIDAPPAAAANEDAP